MSNLHIVKSGIKEYCITDGSSANVLKWDKEKGWYLAVEDIELLKKLQSFIKKLR